MVELLYETDVPMKVAVTEAVQIANKYSTDNSGAFVNGLMAGFMQARGMVSKSQEKEN
jgi:N utilization substance protein B